MPPLADDTLTLRAKDGQHPLSIRPGGGYCPLFNFHKSVITQESTMLENRKSFKYLQFSAESGWFFILNYPFSLLRQDRRSFPSNG